VSDDILSAGSNMSVVDITEPDGNFAASIMTTAAPDTVFDALTTPSAFSNWWVTASGGGTTGDELIIHFGDSPAICRVDEAERPAHVSWTVLDCGMEPDWEGTEIIFDLCSAPDGGTRVDFRHQGLTPQLVCFEMCQSGWTQALGGLLRYVEAVHGKSITSDSATSEGENG